MVIVGSCYLETCYLTLARQLDGRSCRCERCRKFNLCHYVSTNADAWICYLPTGSHFLRSAHHESDLHSLDRSRARVSSALCLQDCRTRRRDGLDDSDV